MPQVVSEGRPVHFFDIHARVTMQLLAAVGPCTPAAAARPPTARPGQRGQRRESVICLARPESPYEPLERAIQVINRVIALGEKTNWGSGEQGAQDSSSSSGSSGESSTTQERWVQFAAVYNSSLSIEQPAGAALPMALRQEAAASAGSSEQLPDSSGGLNDGSSSGSSSGSGSGSGSGTRSSGRQLRDYLALPVEDYSLLDPKWISREEGSLFRFSLPLQDLVSVDLQPEIYFSVLTEPQEARVTLSGTRAALGSPEIDAAFRLNVTAVVSQRQRRRLPAMPDHLPGRPVMRLRRWAAAARGRPWPFPEGQAAAAAGTAAGTAAGMATAEEAAAQQASSSSSSSDAGPEAVAVVQAATDDSSAVPFPGQHVYISHDENDSEEYDEADADLAAAGLSEASLGSNGGASSSSSMLYDSNGSRYASSSSGNTSAMLPSQQTAAAAAREQQVAQAGPRALLHCRTRVTMAVRVPRPLKVVPNALLGYAGSLLLRTILSATLPNFLALLAADYRRWAGIAGTGDSSARQLDAPVGDLFSDAAAAVQEGRQRRQHSLGAFEEALDEAAAPPSRDRGSVMPVEQAERLQ